MGQCPDRAAGPLTIKNGQAWYTSATGYRGRAAGERAMRLVAPPNSSNAGSAPIDISVSGNIDGTGTVRARQSSHSCSYDFTWQK
jgi:hypothetical protein